MRGVDPLASTMVTSTSTCAGTSATDAAAVVLDVESGAELARAGIDVRGTLGMFFTPGFGRDFYVASIPGTVARVFVDEHAKL